MKFHTRVPFTRAAVPAFCSLIFVGAFAHGQEFPNSLVSPLTLDESGWTVFDPAPGSRNVYVSTSTGSDSNLGETPETAVRSLNRAKKLIRDGEGDHLLLRAGDVWEEDFGVWPHSGSCSEYPTVIRSYGEGSRPVIRPGDKQGFRVMNHAVKHLALVGLRFEAPSDIYAERQTGIGVVGPLSDFLVEDCYFEGFAFNITLNSFAGPVENIRLRRNVIVDSLNVRERDGVKSPGHSSGVFANEVRGLLIEECIFDYNGWRADVDGADRSKLNHNIYIQWNCSDIVVRRIISARASNSGIMVRCGGLIEDNVEMSSPSSIAMGSHKGEKLRYSGTVRRNLLLHGSDIGETLQAWGLGLTNVDNSVAEDNLIVDVRSVAGKALMFSTLVTNTVVRRNVAYRWGMPFDVTRKWDTVDIANNVFVIDSPKRQYLRVRTKEKPDQPLSASMRNNTYVLDEAPGDGALSIALNGDSIPDMGKGDRIRYADTSKEAYASFDTTIESYQRSLGGSGGMAEFLAEARTQSKGHWRKEYEAGAVIAHFRTAFKPLIDMTLDEE